MTWCKASYITVVPYLVLSPFPAKGTAPALTSPLHPSHWGPSPSLAQQRLSKLHLYQCHLWHVLTYLHFHVHRPNGTSPSGPVCGIHHGHKTQQRHSSPAPFWHHWVFVTATPSCVLIVPAAWPPRLLHAR